AGELDSFTRQLETKVATKSKELVRSERLASVGFLAAGVPHEINNPLSIISGYAELSLKQLQHATAGARTTEEADAMREVTQALRAIRDEAFRCKEITGKLLSLARGGTERSKEEFSIARIAEEVASLVRGLASYRDRRVVVDLDAREILTVCGNPNEIKQVLLNLVVNALDASPPQAGVVRVEARRADANWVELIVSDNGRGMPPHVLEHVFEPFFTAKRGTSAEPGTGLGLSITHAIVQGHGGTVRAESEGLGRGSRFVVRLPAATVAAGALS